MSYELCKRVDVCIYFYLATIDRIVCGLTFDRAPSTTGTRPRSLLLMSMATSPDTIWSTIWGRPSPTLKTRSAVARTVVDDPDPPAPVRLAALGTLMTYGPTCF